MISVGDPRKAMVLGAVALVTCTMAVYRALPRPEVAVNSLLLPTPSAHTPTAEVSYPVSVNHDPFSHPLLRSADGRTDPPRPKKRGDAGDGPSIPVEIGGELGALPSASGLPVPSPEGEKPAENAGKDRQPEVEGSVIRLDAIMAAGSMAAVLRLGDGAPIVCKQGDTAFGLLRVENITLSGVRLSAHGTEWMVKVGDSVKL